MGSMMGMEWRHGQGEVNTGANIGRDLGMALAFIGFILVMSMLENGQMAKAMAVGCIPVRMVADMLANSSGVSSMALATTISGILILTLENILLIRCTDLECTISPMGIVLKALGTREGDKDWGPILLGMEKPSRVTGIMAFLTFQAHRVCPILDLPWLFTTQKCLMPSRKHGRQPRKPTMWQRLTKE
nr:uncharacterized protein LOC112519506 isoform X2 [Ipomoea batatas]